MINHHGFLIIYKLFWLRPLNLCQAEKRFTRNPFLHVSCKKIHVTRNSLFIRVITRYTQILVYTCECSKPLLRCIPVTVIQGGPPGYFIHISITTPIVSALKNYYRQSFLEAPTDFLNHFWIQVAVSLLKPPHGGFRSKTAATKPFRK